MKKCNTNTLTLRAVLVVSKSNFISFIKGNNFPSKGTQQSSRAEESLKKKKKKSKT